MTDRGSVLPMLAVLVLGGAIVAGLAIDLGRWGVLYREAAFAADAGAEAGAAMIDEDAAYRDLLALDPGGARAVAVEAARVARSRPGRTVAAQADTGRVCVTVRQPFRPGLLRIAGVGSTTITADACAVPGKG